MLKACNQWHITGEQTCWTSCSFLYLLSSHHPWGYRIYDSGPLLSFMVSRTLKSSSMGKTIFVPHPTWQLKCLHVAELPDYMLHRSWVRSYIRAYALNVKYDSHMLSGIHTRCEVCIPSNDFFNFLEVIIGLYDENAEHGNTLYSRQRLLFV